VSFSKLVCGFGMPEVGLHWKERYTFHVARDHPAQRNHHGKPRRIGGAIFLLCVKKFNFDRTAVMSYFAENRFQS